MQIFIHLVFCQFLLLEFLFLSFFYSKKPSAFWQFVLEAVEAAWGQKSIKWLIRHNFSLLRIPSSLITWHIQSQSISSKHILLCPDTLYAYAPSENAKSKLNLPFSSSSSISTFLTSSINSSHWASLLLLAKAKKTISKVD